MSQRHRREDHMRTKFIRINNHNCEACWECVTACPNDVIGKIDLFFHKHSHINHPEDCKGCLKCVRVCEYNAITVNKDVLHKHEKITMADLV
jgi:NAD-dependent dihydropyrimidine dehydrogenase PreA subunit